MLDISEFGVRGEFTDNFMAASAKGDSEFASVTDSGLVKPIVFLDDGVCNLRIKEQCFLL